MATAQTLIPFLSILTSEETTPLSRGILEPSLCLVVQGRKRMLIGRQSFVYGAGSFAVSALHIPTAGQIVAVPYVAHRVAFSGKEIAEIALDARLRIEPDSASLASAANPAGPAAFVAEADAAVLSCFQRLVALLADPQDAAFLAAGIKRELLYRVLRSAQGPLLYRHLSGSDVRPALAWLRENFAAPLHVSALARVCHMSVSSLHHKFKAATTMSPLQYQKRLRLHEARRLLVSGACDAGGAALSVGYESASQFSREYRRLFGAPPGQDARQTRGQQGQDHGDV